MIVRTHSEAGGKPENEDFVIARRHPNSESLYICLLADGQGGRANGALASQAACETAWRFSSNLPPHRLFEDGTWLEIFDQTDIAVAKTEGFTTLIGLAIDRDMAVGASSGDSKAFFVLPEKEMAEWTVHQRKNPPVGSGSVDAIHFGCHGIGGGRLLIVSDGVWKYCGYEALQSSHTQPIDSIPEHLRSAIRGRSGPTLPDDFSVIVVDIP